MPRMIGLFLAFSAVITMIAFRPGGEGTAVALLQTETPTTTNTTEPSGTATATATTSPTVTTTVTPTVTTTPGPPTVPVANFPTSACVGAFPFPTSANVTFTWTRPVPVLAIYLDLSVFDNDMADGTYFTVVLPPGTTSYTWNGLQPGVAHFWRVTAQGLNGDWVSSGFGQFTPCGTQRLLTVTYNCTGGGRATVTFRWAPTSSVGLFQFLDLSLFNNNFAPGTFLGAGPLQGNLQALTWPGILANAIHYYRVNTFTIFGWGPSRTGAFVAQCPS